MRKKLKFGDLMLKDSKAIVPFDIKHKGNVLGIHILNGKFIIPTTKECNAEGLLKYMLEERSSLGVSCADISVLFFICYNLEKVNKLIEQIGYAPLEKLRYWSDLKADNDESGYLVSLKDGGVYYVTKEVVAKSPCDEGWYTDEKAIALLGFSAGF